MKKIIPLFTIILSLTMNACNPAPSPKGEPTEAIDIRQNAPGDSTLYGLACEGCTDSILVLLPNAGGDPDTFDVINAYHNHQIYGRPSIGDKIAVILNPEDKQEALMVVNIERLKGRWCYQVMPTFRNIDKMPERIQRRMLQRIPDSVKQTLLVPREYGIQLKRGYAAQTIGGGRQQSTTDEMSPVEYPKPKRYTEWNLYNGRLILTTDSLRLPHSTKKGSPEHDTADIMLLREDTLILKFKDHTQGYYRKENQ